MTWLARHVLALAFVLLALPVSAMEAVKSAERAAAMLEAARTKLERSTGARNRVLAITQAVRAYDVALLALRSGLSALQDAQNDAQTRYQQARAMTESVVTGLQAVGRDPEEMSLMHPDGPVAAARAGMIMRDMLPSMRDQASELRTEIERLATLSAVQQLAVQDIRDAVEELRVARTRLKTAIFEDRELREPLSEGTQRLAKLAAGSSSLRQLAEGLILLPGPPAPADAVELERIRGRLEWPVQGQIARNFREADAAGVSRQGILVSAPALSVVTAPVTSRVRYTGRFGKHGLLVILEPDPDYLVVLGGLGEILVRAGEDVVTGRPIGVLGGKHPSDEEFLIQLSDPDSAFQEESLYIELRRNGIALDPEPWFEEPTPIASGR